MDKNTLRMLRFAMDYPGWHTFNGQDVATVVAVKALSRMELIETNSSLQFRARNVNDWKAKYEELIEAVILWAKSGETGGNPYRHKFMDLVPWKERA